MELKQEYVNLCAKLGDMYITKQVIEEDIKNLTTQALEKLKEMKRAEPKT